MKAQPENVALVGVVAAFFGIVLMAVLCSLVFGQFTTLLSSRGLGCLILGAIVTTPSIGIASGYMAVRAVGSSDISPYPLAVALALIADFSLVGWVFVL